MGLLVNEELRIRIAYAIYGDGNELPWHRALQIADLVIWEINMENTE